MSDEKCPKCGADMTMMMRLGSDLSPVRIHTTGSTECQLIQAESRIEVLERAMLSLASGETCVLPVGTDGRIRNMVFAIWTARVDVGNQRDAALTRAEAAESKNAALETQVREWNAAAPFAAEAAKEDRKCNP